MQPTILVPRPAEPAAPTGPIRFVYDGRLGQLYIIFLKNLLLSIVTLTIYRFWAKTNVRRYLWSRTSLMGDRFEYTGTGKELFLGFLIVLGFLVVLAGLFFLSSYLARHTPVLSIVLVLLVYATFFYFFFLGHFTALRYRLSRTRWRGIRGAMGGSPWKYGFLALGWALLSALTLGLTAPVAVFRTLGYRLNNSYFGTARAHFDGKAGQVYRRFLVYYFGSIAIGLVVLAVAFFVISSTGFLDDWLRLIAQMARGEEPNIDQLTFQRMQYVLIISIYIAAFAAGLAVLPLICWYTAFLLNYLIGHTHIASARFVGHLTTWRIFGYVIVNFLIMILTLGLGFPWVLHRIMKFVAANIEIEGPLDMASIQQSDMPMPKRGEGLLDLLDPGFI